MFDDRRLRRAGMDYLDAVDLTRHSSWNAYRVWRAGSDRAGRLILLTTKGETAYADFSFDADRHPHGRPRIAAACRRRCTTPPTPVS